MNADHPTLAETNAQMRRCDQVDNESRAREIFRGDWDANGTVSVYLPSDIAVDLLRSLGWEQKAAPNTPNMLRWCSPNGCFYWETSEALQIALAAEAVR